MSRKSRGRSSGTDWIGLGSFGFFLVLVGAIWLFTPNFTDEAIRFFESIHLKNVTGNIVFPSPEGSHPVVYTAVLQFCIVFAISQIIILILRIVNHDAIDKMADTVSGMAFWFSAGYFISLLTSEAIGWFGFVAGVIISGGLAIIASSLVKLLR